MHLFGRNRCLPPLVAAKGVEVGMVRGSTADLKHGNGDNGCYFYRLHNDLAKRRALARPVEAEGRNELERLVSEYKHDQFFVP